MTATRTNPAITRYHQDRISKQEILRFSPDLAFKSLLPAYRFGEPERWEQVCGVYRIRNTKTHDSYIGAAGDIRDRVRNHLKRLLAGGHTTRKLQDNFDRFGIDAFVIDVLARCRGVDLNRVEARLISQIDPTLNGWKPAGTTVDMFLDEIDIEKLREIASKKFCSWRCVAAEIIRHHIGELR